MQLANIYRKKIVRFFKIPALFLSFPLTSKKFIQFSMKPVSELVKMKSVQSKNPAPTMNEKQIASRNLYYANVTYLRLISCKSVLTTPEIPSLTV